MRYLLCLCLCFTALGAGAQTITYNASTNCTGSASAAAASCTLGASGAVGDLLVIASKTAEGGAPGATAALTFSGTASCSTSTQVGPTYHSSGTAFNFTVFACIITASGANTPVVTWTGADGTFTDIAVGTYHTTTSWNASIVDQSTVSLNNTASTSCATGTTATTVNAHDLVIAFCANFNVAQTWGALTGFTSRANSSRNTTAWYDKSVTVNGTQSATIPLSASDDSTGQITAFMANAPAAGNWYVAKGASGSNNGTSWTNAWNEMNQINFSSVACGDTIWLAGGTYAQTITAVKNCSSSGTLNIKRVLSSDSVPVAAAGWSSAFDSQVILLNWAGFAGIRLNGINNVNIDGRFGNPIGSSPVAYGISLRCTTTTGCDGINDGAGNSNYTIQNVEVFGPPCVETANCTGNGASGINLPFGGTGFTYTNVYVHRQGEALRSANWANVTIQNSFIADTHNDGIQHEDIIFVSGSISNFTFRYNKVWMSPNDGMFFFGNETNTQFYRNVLYHSGGALMTFFNGFTHNIFMYNNIFENDGNFGDFQPGWLDFNTPLTMTGAMENNVFENIFLSDGSPPATSDYNAYNTCGDKDSGAHSFCYTSGTQFVSVNTTNPLLSDWHLTSAGVTGFGTAGLNLGAPYNVDPDGNTAPSSGAWAVGVYQNSSAAIFVGSHLQGGVQIAPGVKIQ